MSTTPPTADSGSEHPTADLSELAATDALLDRLALRHPADEDLLDPTAAALNRLLAEIDSEAGADSVTARLVEVLAGRPLYFDGPSVPAVDDQLIDLTSPVEAGPDDSEDDSDDDSARPAVEVVPIAAARSKRWQVAASKITVPVAAASIAVLVLLGGGVSAAVAGDPMAPLNGVGAVMAKLPGVDSSGSKMEDAQKELELARKLRDSDPAQAREHLENAWKSLEDVPDDEKGNLKEDLEILALTIPAGPTPTVPGTTPTPITSGTPVGVPTGDGPVPPTAVPATLPPTSAPAVPATTTTPGGVVTPTTPPTTTTAPEPEKTTTPPPVTTTPSTPDDTPTTQNSAPSSTTTTSAAAPTAQSTPEESATGN